MGERLSERDWKWIYTTCAAIFGKNKKAMAVPIPFAPVKGERVYEEKRYAISV
jgi:hypothetical protein